MTKQFLIQVQPDERTRFLADDAEFRDLIATMVRSVFRVSSTGPMPAVTVVALVPKERMSLSEQNALLTLEADHIAS